MASKKNWDKPTATKRNMKVLLEQFRARELEEQQKLQNIAKGVYDQVDIVYKGPRDAQSADRAQNQVYREAFPSVHGDQNSEIKQMQLKKSTLNKINLVRMQNIQKESSLNDLSLNPYNDTQQNSPHGDKLQILRSQLENRRFT